jgi:hypothetical protein
MPIPPPQPPIADQPLSIVLLGGDGTRAEEMLEDWKKYLDTRAEEHELIYVADQGTLDRLAVLAERLPRLRLVPSSGPGEGRALRAAITEAKNPLLFYTLCHPEYRPEFLGLLLDKAATMPAQSKETDHIQVAPQQQTGQLAVTVKQPREIDTVHLMTGSRAAVPVPWMLRIPGWAWRAFCWLVIGADPGRWPGWLGWRGHAGRLAARILFGLRYHDVACPVRLIRREIFARIPIQSEGSFVHVEILAKANFLGHLMAEEVPLPLGPRADGDGFALVWRDAKRLMQNPDFGPAVLPAPATEAVAEG